MPLFSPPPVPPAYIHQIQIQEKAPMTLICRHLVISGRVQGVGYRAWFSRQAQALGLNGWVRNNEGGTVEAEICGDAASVMELVGRSNEGPPHASVAGIDVTEKPASGLAGFEIRSGG
jgi:acylphosphatase